MHSYHLNLLRFYDALLPLHLHPVYVKHLLKRDELNHRWFISNQLLINFFRPLQRLLIIPMVEVYTQFLLRNYPGFPGRRTGLDGP